jgi:hypothetical protein
LIRCRREKSTEMLAAPWRVAVGMGAGVAAVLLLILWHERQWIEEHPTLAIWLVSFLDLLFLAMVLGLLLFL